MTKRNRWTLEEEDIIYKLYPTASKEQITNLIPNRSWETICGHANRLGVKRTRYKDKKRKKVYGRWFSWHEDNGNIVLRGQGIEEKHRQRMYEHRYVWEFFNGEIKPGYKVFHIDGNKKNNLIENLECIYAPNQFSDIKKNKCLCCENTCKRATTKFCSTECYGRYRSKNKISIGGPKRTKTFEIKCPYCKTYFLQKYKEQVFCCQSCVGKSRIEECRKLGKSMKGKKFSKEHREKLSIIASKRNAARTYTKGVGGTRKDIGHYVRSRWEANFARYLLFTKQNYLYEPTVFTLIDSQDKSIRYRPDFKVRENYYEVKGWWDEKSKLIKRLMTEQYPEITIIYISEKEYLEIQKQYGEQIENWEFK